MKKSSMRLFILAPIVLIAIVAAITLPNILQTYAASTGTFNVSLTIANSQPVVNYVAAGQSDSPAAGTTKDITISFNATDANGVADIDPSNAKVIINQSAVSRTSHTCWTVSSGTTQRMFSCNVTIQYYDLPGTWTINASIVDGASAYAENLTQTFSMGTTYGISINKSSLTFSGSPGDTNVAASNAPQNVINIGNGQFNSMNLTAYDIASGSNTIGAANFNANATANSAGVALANNTMTVIPGASLAVNGTQNLYVFLSIPQGTPNGTYTSVQPWVVTMS